MPDIAATRPASGASVEAAWGAQVHDAVEGVQFGTVSVVKPVGVNVGGSAPVVFPRPYASPPSVTASANSSSVCFAGARDITTTGFTMYLQRIDQNGTTTTQPCCWIAVGVLA